MILCGRREATAAAGATFSGLASEWFNVSTLSPPEAEDHERVTGQRRADSETTGGHNGDVLLPLRICVSDGSGLCRSRKLYRPQFFTRFGIEGAKACIIRGAHERQAAGSNNSAAKAGPARVLLARRQTIGHAQRGSPRDLAGVYIDRDQLAPRRWGTGQMILGFQKRTMPASGPELNSYRPGYE